VHKVRKSVTRSQAELEAIVLGGLLLNPQGLHAVMSRGLLCRSCFTLDAHVVIYEAMEQVDRAGYTADIPTLQAALIDLGTQKRSGGLAYLLKLVEGVPSKYFSPMLEALCGDLMKRLTRGVWFGKK